MPSHTDIIVTLPQAHLRAGPPIAPSGAVLLMLGSWPFGINAASFERLSRRAEFRWPAHERVGRRPVLQYTGPGRDAITLEGVIFPTFRGGDLARLRALAESGTPELLVDGRGGVYGKWVVARLEETRSFLHRNGAPRKIEYTLELEHYGEDAPGGRLSALERAAGAAQ